MIKKISLVAILMILITTVTFFGYKIYNLRFNAKPQVYGDYGRGFSITYPSTWEVNDKYGGFIFKKPNKIENIVADVSQDKSITYCLIGFTGFNNKEKLSIDDFINKRSKIWGTGQHVKLSNYDFYKIENSNAISYFISTKPDEIIKFDITKNNCQKEAEEIVSSIKFIDWQIPQ